MVRRTSLVIGSLALLQLAACIGAEPQPKRSMTGALSESGSGGKSMSPSKTDAGEPQEPAHDEGGSGGAAGKGGRGGKGDDNDRDPMMDGASGSGAGGKGGALASTGGDGGARAAAGSSSAAAGSGHSAAGGGGAGGMESVEPGTPCKTDSECGEGTCSGLWCTNSCTSDAACGTSPRGVANSCVPALNDTHRCFPGCKTDSDCSLYPNTACKSLNDKPNLVCSLLSSSGWPCSADTDCRDKLVCNVGWCTPHSCTSNQDCGTSPTDVQNGCVQNQQKTTLCFPGCQTNTDCSFFRDTSCQARFDGSPGRICAGIAIGNPCSAPSDCGSKYVCVGGTGWCSPSSCSSDADCGISPSGLANRCVQNNSKVNICFPGCASDSDCGLYPGTTCSDGSCSR